MTEPEIAVGMIGVVGITTLSQAAMTIVRLLKEIEQLQQATPDGMCEVCHDSDRRKVTLGFRTDAQMMSFYERHLSELKREIAARN
jgi:hypothetical protein